MTWDELDMESGVWTIPATRMKNKLQHKLPLTAMTREIIQTARTLFGDESPFVFPSPRKGEPLTQHALSKAILRHREEMKITEPFTPHDIRRTVRTRLAALQIEEFVAERVLGHKLEGMLAVYNQHDYIPEKRQALEAWEIRLKKIIGIEAAKRAKVIRLEGRHA